MHQFILALASYTEKKPCKRCLKADQPCLRATIVSRSELLQNSEEGKGGDVKPNEHTLQPMKKRGPKPKSELDRARSNRSGSNPPTGSTHQNYDTVIFFETPRTSLGAAYSDQVPPGVSELEGVTTVP